MPTPPHLTWHLSPTLPCAPVPPGCSELWNLAGCPCLCPLHFLLPFPMATVTPSSIRLSLSSPSLTQWYIQLSQHALHTHRWQHLWVLWVQNILPVYFWAVVSHVTYLEFPGCMLTYQLIFSGENLDLPHWTVDTVMLPGISYHLQPQVTGTPRGFSLNLRPPRPTHTQIYPRWENAKRNWYNNNIWYFGGFTAYQALC